MHKRDDTQIPPETYSKTNSMEGVCGVRMDPDVLRRREQESVAKKLGVPSEYMGSHVRPGGDDGSGAEALPKKPHFESFCIRMYGELGENVMDWLSGVTDQHNYGVTELTQETMDKLGVPREGTDNTHKDNTAVHRVFGIVSSDDSCVGPAAPQTKMALKAE